MSGDGGLGAHRGEVTSRVDEHLGGATVVPHQLTPHGVSETAFGLDVLVQQLVEIQLWAVPGEEKDTEPILVLREPRWRSRAPLVRTAAVGKAKPHCTRQSPQQLHPIG